MFNTISFYDLKNTTIHLWLPKLIEKVIELASGLFNFQKDIRNQSYTYLELKICDLLLTIKMFYKNLDVYTHTLRLNYLGAYLNHEFSIFGIRNIKWSYSKIYLKESVLNSNLSNALFERKGIWLENSINKSNASYSKNVFLEMLNLNPHYQPIDWQLDPTCDFRYNSQLWYKKALTDVPVESDIKIPWELGRLQHIPRMLVFSMNDQNRDKIVLEVQCQILDFISSNPPRWGVNWRSTMDVAIRAANMSMCLNILIKQQPEFESSACCTIIKSSVFDHYNHILKNPEKKQGLGNNHYLANIVGLLYSVYSIDDESIILSLNKYVKELFHEINKQFLQDGGNFESSTTYHAFSTEMCIYGMAIIDRMQEDEKIGQKLQINIEEQDKAKHVMYKAFKYLDAIINEDGTLPQLGDNDSGRFFKWTLNGELLNSDELKSKYQNSNQSNPDNDTLDEDYLNYSSVLNLCKGYFGLSDNQTFEGELIQSISGITSYKSDYELGSDVEIYPSLNVELKYKNQTTIKIDNSDRVKSNLSVKLHAFQNTGVYILQNDSVKVVINGMNCNVRQYWPHGHNDKLSFSINFKGQDHFRDPGSYVYTGNPELRNRYRSVKAHNSPNHGKEQNPWLDGKPGVFRLIPKSKVKVIGATDNSIKLSLVFNDVIHSREWIVNVGEIVVIDESNKPFDSNYYPAIHFSNGYGKMLAEFA